MSEIMFLVISAVISGVTDWKQISIFGQSRLSWIQKYFPSMKSVPHPSTLSRLFSKLDTDQFGEYFIEWVNTLSELNQGDVIAIDGKTIRGSIDESNGKAAIHMVSAFVSHQSLCLGQLATDQKSNEITAIPKLLDLLTLEGSTVTIDAMGCQKDISKKILEKKADYVLQVKGNQKGLLEQVEKLFEISTIDDYHQNHYLDHGRAEERKCDVISDLTHLDGYKNWPGIRSIIRIESSRTIRKTGKKEEGTRYYISSKIASAQRFNQDIRAHWAIENKLHWSLDVSLREDSSKKRIASSAINFSFITKIALNIIKKSDKQLSKKNKMLKAMLDDQFREELLNI